MTTTHAMQAPPRMRHSAHSVVINAPYDAAYDYLEDWRNQPQWATSFVQAIRPDGDGGAVIASPQGEIPVRFRCDRALGVLDMIFPGDSILPTRLTPIGPSGDSLLLYTFAFSMPADAPEEVFRQAQRNMDEELGQLKRILEERSGVGSR